MPVVKKKTKKAKKTQKPTKALAVSKSQTKLKHSVAYYDCCSAETKKGLKGVKITQICHHCKHNSQKYALVKVQEREEEKQKITPIKGIRIQPIPNPHLPILKQFITPLIQTTKKTNPIKKTISARVAQAVLASTSWYYHNYDPSKGFDNLC